MASSEDLFILRLKSLIDANVDDPSFSVDTICRELGLSRAQLHRIVKEQVDLSVTLYVRKVRMEKANLLLANTGLRISEVADRVGINNPQNFSKYFANEFSISPTEFRRLRQAPVKETEPLLPQASTPVGTPLPLVWPLHVPKKHITDYSLPRLSRRLTLYGLVLIGLMLGLGIYLRPYLQPATRPTDDIVTSLAVLPLINLGPVETAPICEGLMDDIHTAVSLIRHLRVTARSSSDQYRSSKKNIWQISEDLRVANILRGKMLKTGNQIQMKMELINAREDRLIWVKTYSLAYSDVFQLTEQITNDVARELGLEKNPTAAEKLNLARTKNMEAYNDFLQGRQLVVTRKKDKILESIAKFDHALALDSNFAEVYAYKGLVYSLLSNLGYTEKPSQSYELAQQNALKALRIDPTNSTAYGVLGTIYADTYQWQAAETSFRIALQDNPNDAQANYWYSLLLRSTGRLNEAIHYSSQAIALDPLYPVILSGHIVTCAYANRFDLAQASLTNGQSLFGDSFIFHIALGYFHLSKGNYPAASANFARGLALNPQYVNQTPVQIYCEAKSGNRAKAIKYLQTLTNTIPRTYYQKAIVFAGLNQKDSCLRNLKIAADLGYVYKDMQVFPVFRPYWAEPAFQAVLRQYRYPINR